MPPAIYEKVLAQVQAKLRTVYARAETPIEAPGKTDHGDVDVIVVAEEGSAEPSHGSVAELLGAVDWFQVPKSSTTHYAVPWPEDGDDDDIQERRRFVQVDVNQGVTVEDFQHTLFMHAHGDIGVILGAMLRRFGFVSTPSGFFIRIEELESWNKNYARVKLSSDPDSILEYLGLDVDRYKRKFDSWDELFSYASKCRFHDPKYGEKYDDQEVNEKFEVKAHDRSKAHKRPMFRYWLEEYLPQHRKDTAGSASQLSRDEVIQDAKDFFGEQKANEFDERKRTGMQTMAIEKFWPSLRKSLPCEGSDLTYALKGLKYEIANDVPEPSKEIDERTDVQKAYAAGRFDEVRKWVDENWKEVKDRQQQRDRVKSTTKLLTHLENSKTVEAAGVSV